MAAIPLLFQYSQPFLSTVFFFPLILVTTRVHFVRVNTFTTLVCFSFRPHIVFQKGIQKLIFKTKNPKRHFFAVTKLFFGGGICKVPIKEKILLILIT